MAGSHPVRLPHVVAAWCLSFGLVIIPLTSTAYPPLLDYPFHIARAHIIAHWSESPLLREWYTIHTFLLPNVGMDLIVPLLASVLPIDIAGRVFIALTFGLTLSGCAFLHRSIHGHLSLWPFVSSIFLFNWVLLLGFMNYLLGLGLLLWATGIWIILSRSAAWLRIFSGSILAVALFFSHAAALGLYAIIVAGYELQRSLETLRRSKRLAASGPAIGASIFIIPTYLFIRSPTALSAASSIRYAHPWLWHKAFIIFNGFVSGNWLADISLLAAAILFLTFVRFHGRVRRRSQRCRVRVFLTIPWPAE